MEKSWNEVKKKTKNGDLPTLSKSKSDKKDTFKVVLANQHYWQYGWELVSQRSDDDHIRND